MWKKNKISSKLFTRLKQRWMKLLASIHAMFAVLTSLVANNLYSFNIGNTRMEAPPDHNCGSRNYELQERPCNYSKANSNNAARLLWFSLQKCWKVAYIIVYSFVFIFWTIFSIILKVIDWKVQYRFPYVRQVEILQKQLLPVTLKTTMSVREQYTACTFLSASTIPNWA